MKASNTVGLILFLEKRVFSESHRLVVYVECHSELSQDIFPLHSPSCYPQIIFGTNQLLHSSLDFLSQSSYSMRIPVTGMDEGSISRNCIETP